MRGSMVIVFAGDWKHHSGRRRFAPSVRKTSRQRLKKLLASHVAEVPDADGYEAFRENGRYDQATASAFREHVLKRGGTEDPAEPDRRFRGRDAEVALLLKHRGLTD